MARISVQQLLDLADKTHQQSITDGMPEGWRLYVVHAPYNSVAEVYCGNPDLDVRFLVALADAETGLVLAVGDSGLIEGRHERYAPSMDYLSDEERAIFTPRLTEKREAAVTRNAAKTDALKDDRLAAVEDAKRLYYELFPDGPQFSDSMGSFQDMGDVIWVWTRAGFDDAGWRRLTDYYTPEFLPSPRVQPPVTGLMARPKRREL